jgi:predicted transcriptional regulator
MDTMIVLNTEKHRDFGSVPFLTTTQPLEEVCIMANITLSGSIRICNIEGCHKKHKAHGLCSKHLLQFTRGHIPGQRTYRDANEIFIKGDIAEIVLYDKQGHERARTIIDTIDIEKVCDRKWRLSNKRVASHGKNGENIFIHRLINETPEGMDTDHIDRNQLNNRRTNLRTATHTENMRNRIKRSGSSKYKGVTWVKQREKWMARIKHGDREKSLGHYATEEEAARVYDDAAQELFGEFAKLNFA